MRKLWTVQETAEFIKMYPTTTSKVMAEYFNVPISKIYARASFLKLNKDKDWLYQYYKDNYSGYPATQFKPGCKSWNKGIKGLQIGGKATQFKKGRTPHNTKPVGYRSVRDGYLFERTENGFEMVHVLLWERVNGKVPKGKILKFKDGNRQNICIENLEIIDRTELMKRNSIQNLPQQLLDVVRLKASLTRKINSYGKEQNK
jgi:hypothetical protein